MAWVVTGANKGIGLEIVRGLLQRTSGRVFLGSRSVARGEAALQQLEPELAPRCSVLELDVTDADSIANATNTVRNELDADSNASGLGSGLAGLINNAGGVPDSSPFGW